jgi:hypothetical protein
VETESKLRQFKKRELEALHTSKQPTNTGFKTSETLIYWGKVPPVFEEALLSL